MQLRLEPQQVLVVGFHQQQEEQHRHQLEAQAVVRFRPEPQQVLVVALPQAWEVVQCHQSQKEEQRWHQLEAQVAESSVVAEVSFHLHWHRLAVLDVVQHLLEPQQELLVALPQAQVLPLHRLAALAVALWVAAEVQCRSQWHH